MDVVDEELCGSTGRERDGTEHARQRLGRGDHTLLVDALHGSRWEVGTDDDKVAGEVAGDGVDDRELREEHLGVKEARNENTVGAADVIRLLDEDVWVLVLKLFPHNLSLLGVGDDALGEDVIDDALCRGRGKDDGAAHVCVVLVSELGFEFVDDRGERRGDKE